MLANFFYGNGNFNIIRDIEDLTPDGARRIVDENHVFGAGNAFVDIRYAYKGGNAALNYYAVEGSSFQLGAGNNVLSITSSGNAMKGGAISAGAGADRVSIAAGKESDIALESVYMHLGDGNNTVNVFGKVLDSRIMTGRGNDVISVSSLWGTNATNTSALILGDGNKQLNIGSLNGWSYITAGRGANILRIGDIAANSAITLGDGNNTISFLPSTGLLPTTWSGKITTGVGNDTITAAKLSGGTIDAGHGNNTVRVNELENNASISTGAGNDRVFVTQASNSAISLGDGNNSLEIVTGVKVSIAAEGGNDTVIVNGYLDSCKLDLGAGNDTLTFGRNAYITDASDPVKFSCDGGVGVDTIRLGLQQNNINLGADLSAVPTAPDPVVRLTDPDSKITGFEILDMTGGGVNSLFLDSASLAQFSNRLTEGAITLIGSPMQGSLQYYLTQSDSVMRIHGDRGDRVVFDPNEDWNNVGTVSYAGVRYTVWVCMAGWSPTSVVLIQDGLIAEVMDSAVTDRTQSFFDPGDPYNTPPIPATGSPGVLITGTGTAVKTVTYRLGQDNNWYGERFAGGGDAVYKLTTNWGDTEINLGPCTALAGSSFTLGVGDHLLKAGQLGEAGKAAVTVNAAASLGLTQVFIGGSESGALVNNTTFTSGSGSFALHVENTHTTGTGLLNSTLTLGTGASFQDIKGGAFGIGIMNSRLNFNGAAGHVWWSGAEIHGGIAMCGGSISVGSASLADYIFRLKGRTAGVLGVSNSARAAITLGRGDDYLSITTTETDSATVRWANIDAGEGNNTILIQDQNDQASQPGQPTAVHALAWSTLRAGNGNNDVTIGLDPTAVQNWTITPTSQPLGIANSSITLGNGNNTLDVWGGMLNAPITMGGGNNKITITTANAFCPALLNASHINLGNGHNKLDITGSIIESNLRLGAGDNTIDINGAAIGSAINLGNGNNTVMLTGGMDSRLSPDARFKAATLTAGNGNNIIEIGGAFGAFGTMGGVAGLFGGAIALGNGNNNITLTGLDLGMVGYRIGNVTSLASLTTGTGNDTIIIEGTNWAGMRHATLTDRGGNNTISVTGGQIGMDFSTLTTGAGNDHIKIATDGTNAEDLAMLGSTLNAGDGNNVVEITGGVHAGFSSVAGKYDVSKIQLGRDNDVLTITAVAGGTSVSGLYGSTITDTGGNNHISVTGSKHGMESAPVSANNNTVRQASINTGAGNDVITVTGLNGCGLYGARITTTGGDNLITVTGTGPWAGLRYSNETGAESSINTGNGNDTIIVTGGDNAMNRSRITDTGGNNAITVNSGTVSVDGTGNGTGTGAAMHNNSIISLGAGSDTVTLHGGVGGAMRDGSSITSKGGSNTITLYGAMNNRCQISTTTGADRITVAAGNNVTAMSGSQIVTTGGNNVITVTGGHGISGGWLPTPTSTHHVAISTGAGHDVITVKGEGVADLGELGVGLRGSYITDTGGNNVIEVYGARAAMVGDRRAGVINMGVSGIRTGSGNDVIRVSSDGTADLLLGDDSNALVKNAQIGTAMLNAEITSSGGNNQVCVSGLTAMDNSSITLASTAANINYIDIDGLSGTRDVLTGGSSITCGAGMDILTIKQAAGTTGAAVHNSRIDLGGGHNFANITGAHYGLLGQAKNAGDVHYKTAIHTGTGDDYIVIQVSDPGGIALQNAGIYDTGGNNAVFVQAMGGTALRDAEIVLNCTWNGKSWVEQKGSNLLSINGDVEHSFIKLGGSSHLVLSNSDVADSEIRMSAANDAVSVYAFSMGANTLLDGGAGLDRLFFRDGGNINLSDLTFNDPNLGFKRFEVVDITNGLIGGGAQTLTLTLQDVQNMNVDKTALRLPGSTAASNSILFINGDTIATTGVQDEVSLTGFNLVAGQVTYTMGTIVSGWDDFVNTPITYNVYQGIADPSHFVLVQNGVLVT